MPDLNVDTPAAVPGAQALPSATGILEPTWLQQVNTFDSPCDMRALAATTESLFSEILADIESVDFNSVCRTAPNPHHLVTLLRVSFTFRHRIRGWTDLRDFASFYLVKNGVDAAKVMRGLGP